jgi:hypothetical protein
MSGHKLLQYRIHMLAVVRKHAKQSREWKLGKEAWQAGANEVAS